MVVTLENDLIELLRQACGNDLVEQSPDKVNKLSKDFYWYSPLLKAKLDDKVAGVVAMPRDLESLKRCVSACCEHQVPITIRGGGTGNYGQCIPLHGGVVLDLTHFDKILSLENGIARVEPGARLETIEVEARKVGYELRCMPSTWVKSTMGGFFCGGSGGVGSITWGGIIQGDNVVSVTILSAETVPKLIKLDGRDAIKALHTYGTNGIMVEIEMRLAPKVDYQQLIFAHKYWDTLFDWTDAFARKTEYRKRLVTQFECPTPQYFRPLTKFYEEDDHVTFILVDQAQAEKLTAEATEAGIRTVYNRPLSDPPRPPYITDYTWNHTTLWALKADPTITYLQAGFGTDYKKRMQMLWEKFPGEIMMHIEWTAGNSKMNQEVHRPLTGEDTLVGGIPLLRYKSEERLQEILDYCEEIGVFIANPHTYFLEEGGRHPDIEEKRALKKQMDPLGLLNPGKMKTYPHNPFQSGSES